MDDDLSCQDFSKEGIKNLHEKWKNVCKKCYKQPQMQGQGSLLAYLFSQEKPPLQCSNYFPENCEDMFNCDDCTESYQGVQTPKSYCEFTSFANKQECTQKTCSWKNCQNWIEKDSCKPAKRYTAAFSNFLDKCGGIVYMGTTGSKKVFLQNYFKITRQDNSQINIQDITNIPKFFGVRCINIILVSGEKQYSFFENYSSQFIPENNFQVSKEYIDDIFGTIILSPGINRIYENFSPDVNLEYLLSHTPSDVQQTSFHYFFTMIKPTDDYDVGETDSESLLLAKMLKQNHEMPYIDAKIKAQEREYTKQEETHGEGKEEYVTSNAAEYETQMLPKDLFSKEPKNGELSSIYPLNDEEKAPFVNFIHLMWPNALNFFKYEAYIDPCGHSVCGAIAYNLFFLYTKLCRNKTFTFADKAFITLTFILHKYPPNKKPTKGWYFKGGGLIGIDGERQLVWVEKYKEAYGLNDTECKDCEDYSFKYDEDYTNNPCGEGCKTRLDKIVRKIEEKNEEEIKQLEKDIEENRTSKMAIINQFRKSEWLSPLPFFPREKPTKKQLKEIQDFDEKSKEYKVELKGLKFDKKIIALLCCDRNVKKNGFSKWKCPSGDTDTRGPSYIQRSFYYYIRQVFGEFATVKMSSEKIPFTSYIPERYIEGAEELEDFMQQGNR